jgi:hypothetical protein
VAYSPTTEGKKLQKRIQAIQGKSLEEQMSVILALGEYFSIVLAAEAHKALITDTARLLNACSNHFDHKSYHSSLLSHINSSLGKASSIHGNIRQNTFLDPNVQQRVKELGHSLKQLAAKIPLARRS